MKSDVGAASYIPLWILMNHNIPHGAVRLWGVIHAAWTDRLGIGVPPRSQLAHDLDTSVATLDRWIKILVKEHALTIVGRSGYTSEYLVHVSRPITDDEGRVIIREEGQPDKPKRKRRLQPSLLDNTVRREVKKEISKVLVLVRFDHFWSKYPKKVGRAPAKREWLKLNVERDTALWNDISSGLYRAITFWQSERRQSRYIPNPVTFLKNRMWEDEMTVVEAPKVLTKHTERMVASTDKFLERHQKTLKESQ
jgi:hypothetical protein|tara:strand:+ start:1861 stop:2616 length:756 start_codon:yes stop_codon:yes gene_type:complete